LENFTVLKGANRRKKKKKIKKTHIIVKLIHSSLRSVPKKPKKFHKFRSLERRFKLCDKNLYLITKIIKINFGINLQPYL